MIPSLRWKWKFPILFMGICLLLVVFASLPTRAAPLSQPYSQEAPSLPNLDLVLLIDESGSAWGTTDPEPVDGGLPYRIKAAQLLINILSVEQGRENPNHTVSIYLFGTSIVPVIERTPIVGNAPRIGDTLVAKHLNLGWTDVEQALQVSLDDLQTLPTESNRRSVIVLITDGRPETATATLFGNDSAKIAAIDPYLKRIVAMIGDIRDVPNGDRGCPNTTVSGPLYVLAVDLEDIQTDERYITQEYKDFWRQPTVAGNQYQYVEKFIDLNGEVSRLAANLLCAAPIDLSERIQQPTKKTFTVEESYASVIFTIITSGTGSNMEITAPDGTVFAENMPNVQVAKGTGNEVWSIRQEDFAGVWAGEWNVTVEGEGDVQFSFTKFPKNYRIILREPSNVQEHTAGLPLTIVGQVVNNQNEGYPGEITSFEITCERDWGRNNELCPKLQVEQVDSTTYQTAIERPLEGNYTIRMKATLDNGQTADLIPSEIIQVIRHPYATIIEPNESTELSTDSEFEVKVLIGTYDETGIAPIDEFTAQKTTVIVSLRREDTEEILDSQTLDFVPPDGNMNITHSGTMMSPNKPGRYELVVRTEYESGRGEVVNESIASVNIAEGAVIPTPEPEPPEPRKPINPLIPLGVLGMLAAGGGAFYLSRIPKLNGAMLTSKGISPIHMSGRGHVVTLDTPSGDTAKVRLFRRRISGGGIETVARVVKLSGASVLRIGNVPVSQGTEEVLAPGKKIALQGGNEYDFNE